MQNTAQQRSLHIQKLSHHIQHWGQGYFDIDPAGEIIVGLPDNPKAQIKLSMLAEHLAKTGLRFPTIIRFLDILEGQLTHLYRAFEKALQLTPQTNFIIAYPIKVNQHQLVVDTLLNTLPTAQAAQFGLEVGSKPELLTALAKASVPQQTIICNGYKDLEFIQLALLGKQLNLNTLIVIEKLSEIDLIAKASEQLSIPPTLGVRVRLHQTGKGNWQNTGGHKAKFGLIASQLITLIETLKRHQLLSCLKLLHIHIGSQVSCLDDIQRCVIEATRYYVELRTLEAPLEYFDVGGGLAIDYQGSHSADYFSSNYTFEEYAHTIVSTLTHHCQEAVHPVPTLVVESGRALTAHHAMVLTQIIDKETKPNTIQAAEPPSKILLHTLWSLHQQTLTLTLDTDVQLLWTQLRSCFDAIETEFFQKILTLPEKAQCERFFYAATHQLYRYLVRHPPHPSTNDTHSTLCDTLKEWINTKLFINLSLFQSIPDVWGINQIFPILPLSGLNHPQQHPANLYDITCDSDGRIDQYNTLDPETTKPAHHWMIPEWDDNAHPYIGIFLTGAYQEILGDIHNLFGTTDAIGIRITGINTFQIEHQTAGDTIETILEKVNYDPQQLLEQLMQQLAKQSSNKNSQVSDAMQKLMARTFINTMNSYTYFKTLD